MCKLELFEQELKLSKSEQTVKSYSRQFKLFLEYFEGADLRYLSKIEIKSYILSLQEIFGYSAIVHAISAIKFYYSKINSRKRILNIPNPPKPKTLPNFLSINEIQLMIKYTLNLKHKAIIETMFCHGLRRSELLNLKITDIDSENMLLKIHESKGIKDRNIPLSESCLTTLRDYYKAFKPKIYLFNGDGNIKYSGTSLRNVIKSAAKKAGVKRNVKVHDIRHSFASHLVSINVNLKKIQEWLGHSNLKTTEIYCHLQQEENPIKLAS